MTLYSVTTSQPNDQVFLADGDALSISSSGVVRNVAGYGSSISADISGTVDSTNFGGLGSFSLRNIEGEASVGDVVTVRASGIIKGTIGLYVDGYNALLTNSGLIEGTLGDGIALRADHFDVLTSNAQATTIENSGTIKTDLESVGGNEQAGILVAINGTVTVNNRVGGTLSGGSVAYRSTGDAVDMITNEGTIHGDVFLGNGNDFFYNTSGHIDAFADSGSVARGSIHGGFGDDSIYGGAEAENFYGDEGNDLIRGEGGADTIFGGDGDDTALVGGDGSDTVWGGAGSDYILGEADNDTLYGEDGADIIDGGAGSDTMTGGSGNDHYRVNSFADSTVEDADEGTDSIELDIRNRIQSDPTEYVLSDNVEDIFIKNTSEVLNLTGNALANNLIGNSSVNVLNGMDGNDTLDGGAGADILSGGIGDDTYSVDNAGDTVVELASSGIDTVNATISFSLGANIEKLTLIGNAAINATGNTLANTLTGNSAANILDGGTGADRMTGQGGNDTYVVDTAGDVVVEAVSDGTDTVNASVSVELAANVEALVLTGTGAINGTGNNLANTITGNAAANVLNGGVGADRLVGAAGNDTYVVDNAGDVVVELASGGTDTIQSSVTRVLANNIENLTLTGTGAINGTGNTLANVIFGNGGANTLTGLAGNDILNGGLGNDRLIGGAGVDTLNGGAGADRFIFSALSDSTNLARDTIQSFSRASADVIDLSLLDANSRLAGNQVFTFKGATAFTNKAGELIYGYSGTSTVVKGDVNGDGTADFVFTLNSKVALVASDFVL